jgi:hypothetical protein
VITPNRGIVSRQFIRTIALGAKIIAIETGLLLVAIYAVERHRRLVPGQRGAAA